MDSRERTVASEAQSAAADILFWQDVLSQSLIRIILFGNWAESQKCAAVNAALLLPFRLCFQGSRANSSYFLSSDKNDLGLVERSQRVLSPD